MTFGWTQRTGPRDDQAVAETIKMRPARRRSRTKKAAPKAPPAKPQDPLSVPFFLDHGRAWINGDEVGGPDPRFAHLNRSYD
jgi:hypothetical protein